MGEIERSNLVPFVRRNLDILFVGLNPAKGSSRNRHYFSVSSAFWNQLYDSGLLTSKVDKSSADDIVFRTTESNSHNWSYGVTDLVKEIAESDSSRIRPTRQHCEALKREILEFHSRVVVLLHGKVITAFLPFLGHSIPSANVGRIGALIEGCTTMFFGIAFPHGNAISAAQKVAQYRAIERYLLDLDCHKLRDVR